MYSIIALGTSRNVITHTDTHTYIYTHPSLSYKLRHTRKLAPFSMNLQRLATCNRCRRERFVELHVYTSCPCSRRRAGRVSRLRGDARVAGALLCLTSTLCGGRIGVLSLVEGLQ